MRVLACACVFVCLRVRAYMQEGWEVEVGYEEADRKVFALLSPEGERFGETKKKASGLPHMCLPDTALL